MVKNKDSRQIEVLQYIYEEVQEKGYPPTVREIGNAVKLSSTSTVHGHLSRLEKNGFIHYESPYSYTRPNPCVQSESRPSWKLGFLAQNNRTKLIPAQKVCLQ